MFFDGVVFIIGFVLLGNYLESVAKLRATDAVHSLMTLQPNLTRVVQEDDYAEMIATTAVRPHSLIKVLTGELFQSTVFWKIVKQVLTNQP